MLFSKFRKRRKKNYEEIREIEESKYVELIDKKTKSQEVVEMCEQLIECAREFEDARTEYDLVTHYLNDIEIVDSLSGDNLKPVYDSAYNVSRLNKARNEYMKTEQKLSDSQFIEIQEREEEIPKAINRLKANEDDLYKINKDLNYLEDEKLAWEIGKNDFEKERDQLKTVSILMLVLFGLAVLILVLASFILEIQVQLPMIIIAFIAVIGGAYVYLKSQDCSKEIKKCEININYAITLENKVKIKYVNVKNAVDYACEKYHVSGSKELNDNYEKYLEMVRDREKFRRTSDELDYYSREMIRKLEKFHLYDTKVWPNHANAIIDKKEMVELKHDLIVRRQKLRTRMEFNINSITELRSEILLHKNQLGDKAETINQILRKIAELNLTC